MAWLNRRPSAKLPDPDTATEQELGAWLEHLFAEEPALRPRPQLHDYQLTYPPAIHIENCDAYRRAPTDEEYLRDACGPHKGAGYYFHFGFCLESKPVTASGDKLAILAQAGFRRINLGVQTLDPELYCFHHQREDLGVALDAIERARSAGFEFINIDLMTGLERQTPESWTTTLRALERLVKTGSIDSVFIYPFHDDPRSRTFTQPGAVPSFPQTAHSDAQARALLTRLGWKELGARFYRSPRHVRREILELAKVRMNPAYGECLYHGLGNSSFSIGDRATFLNYRDVSDYCAAVERGRMGIAYWRPLNNMQRAARDVTFDLLYSPITRLRSRAKKYGADTMERHRRLFNRWTDLGLAEQNAVLGTFSLTSLGKLVHQQMIPQHYLPEDRRALDGVMEERLGKGAQYRGY